MTQLLSLGAINKLTGKYVYPKIANKKDNYVCPECNKDLILCQGDIRVHHFRHKIDNINPCHHYSNPTETQIHKDAKQLMKTILENKTPIQFIRECVSCKNNEMFEIPEITELSNIQLEYNFEYNGKKVADVAYIDNNEILCIFEICNTHKTKGENRPEPWFEIDANILLTMVNSNDFQPLIIKCIRCEKCDECIEKEKMFLIENIRRKNNTKLIDLEQKLKKAIQNSNDDYWGKDDYGEGIYRKQINNIKDEVEIELVKQNIVYKNNNDVCFTIKKLLTDEYIELNSMNLISVGKYGECKITITELYNWYFNIEINIIDREIKHNNLICNLLHYVELQDVENTNDILSKIKQLQLNIPQNIEIDFVKNNIKFYKDTQGYKFTHPKTGLVIKYSYNQKLYLNGEWIKGIKIIDIIRWYNSLLPNNINDKNNPNEINIKTNNILFENISNKLKSSTTYNQKKKYKSLLELLNVVDNLYINFDDVLKSYNDYHLTITHPITLKKISYHLKKDYISIIGINVRIEYLEVIKNINLWLNDTPYKLEKIIKWANNHKYVKSLLFLLSTPIIEINYETKKQNNLDDEADFIIWLNSFDNNLNILTDYCMLFDWKLDNIIFWLKSDGIFKRCLKCNCIYSYLKNSFVCKNKYCININ